MHEVSGIPMFTRARSIRVLASLVIALSLLAGSLASTLAAVANVTYGGGTTVGESNVSGATPETVSPGNVAGFYLWAKNSDSANLSTFFLTATTTAAVRGAYWGRSADGPFTPCDTSKGLKCDFGPFNSGDEVFVVAAFTLGSPVSTSTTNCLTDPNRTKEPTIKAGMDPTGDSWVCVDFQWGSNSGFVPGKNQSRGDAYHWFDAVNTDTGQDSAAQFPFDSSLLTVSDTQALGKGNPQFTQVAAPAGAVGSAFGTTGIGVADHNVSSPCLVTSSIACSTNFLAEWSQVDVNSGKDFDVGTPWVVIDIGVYGVSASRISTVYHFYQINDTGPWYLEQLAKCASETGPATTSSAACFWVKTLKGSSSQVTVWTHHNGKLNMG
jgi:hypothetical protein